MRHRDQIGGSARKHHTPTPQHRQPLTALPDVFNNMRRQQHRPLGRHFAEQIAEAHPFFGIQPGGRRGDDQQARIAEQGLCDAAA